MLDAKIASALNNIIQNSQFKKVSLEEQKAQKEDRFSMIYNYLRLAGAHDAVLDYAHLLSVTLRDDNIQEFDTRRDRGKFIHKGILNALTCACCEQNTLTRHIFSYLRAFVILSHTTHWLNAQGSSVCARHPIHVSCAVFDLSSTLSSHSSFVSPIFHFIFYVGQFGAKPLCASANEEFCTLANNAPLTGYEPNFFDDTTFDRPLKFSSRSNPATPGPRTCKTRRSLTTPSAERSFHLCSLWSEKN